jgi:signal transduction histidine kinase
VLVPLLYRDRTLGVLAAFDRLAADPDFGTEDEQVLRAFAASAATAVATAQTVQSDRLRHTLRAAEAERRRWARELHDETLQGLGGLKVVLAGASRMDDIARIHSTLLDSVEHVTREIENLRAIITELRPAALDELGLVPAIEALVDRVSAVEGLEIECSIGGLAAEKRLDPEIETTVYRLVQEALTNVGKHARAQHVRVSIDGVDGRLAVDIADDGGGFDPAATTNGFGLAGMGERVHLAGGRLTVMPSEAGTTVHAELPLEPAA